MFSIMENRSRHRFRFSEKVKIVQHFLPTRRRPQRQPRPSLHPRAPRAARSAPCARVQAGGAAAAAARGDALRSWNFAFVHSRLLVGRARSGKHVSRVTCPHSLFDFVSRSDMTPRRQGANGEREPEDARFCCVPGECLRSREPVHSDDAVRVLCNNDTCNAGRYMHRECFEQWEVGVLAYLKSCGRARSWSERQRHQNLWTKKGYDLAYKACGCRCGRGHLKKDLDWAPPGAAVRAEEEKKRRRRTRSGRTPATDGRPRAFSLSSSGSCSPPSALSEPSASPTHAPTHAITPAKRNSKPEIVSDRIR